MALEKKISDWIKNYLKKNNLSSLVVGVSGGIDSAVTSTLCAMTGFKTNLVIMPIHQKKDETSRGIEHCKWLNEKFSNVEIFQIDLSEAYDQFCHIFPIQFNDSLTLANTRARIRMTSLYYIAGNTNGIVVGTGNKVEDFGVGFFTKYGDGGVDISPIADLMKSEVYELGENLGILKSIMLADPTDGLWEDERTDEQQLGVTYDELEWAMMFNGDELSLNDKQKNILSIYRKHRSKNFHKMKNIPIYKNE